MPPVDRGNPIRARSSESSLSFMEFMREFPDNETCLRHVWRERFSPDGEHAFCERCEAERVLMRCGLSRDDRMGKNDHPSGLQEQKTPLAIDPGGDNQDDRAEQVRYEVAHGRRGRDLEVEQRERSHVEGRADKLGCDLRSHANPVSPLSLLKG